MPDILHDFPIKAGPSRVFHAVSAPADLDQWWTVKSAGEPRLGAECVSCYCWAMYLRVLRRYLEHGERVPYEGRLDA
jgi:uncharacterized protein YndB with AHSA1/START domain